MATIGALQNVFSVKFLTTFIAFECIYSRVLQFVPLQIRFTFVFLIALPLVGFVISMITLVPIRVR